MTHKILYFSLRMLGTIVFGTLVAIALSWIATDIVVHAYWMIPEFFVQSFSFSPDIAKNVGQQMIIPGLGFINSIINSPSIGIRLAIFIYIIYIVVITGIIVLIVAYILKRIINGNLFLTIIYGIIAALLYIFLFYFIFINDTIISMGIERGIWFGIVAFIVLAILGGTHCLIIYIVRGIDDEITR